MDFDMDITEEEAIELIIWLNNRALPGSHQAGSSAPSTVQGETEQDTSALDLSAPSAPPPRYAGLNKSLNQLGLMPATTAGNPYQWSTQEDVNTAFGQDGSAMHAAFSQQRAETAFAGGLLQHFANQHTQSQRNSASAGARPSGQFIAASTFQNSSDAHSFAGTYGTGTEELQRLGIAQSTPTTASSGRPGYDDASTHNSNYGTRSVSSPLTPYTTSAFSGMHAHPQQSFGSSASTQSLWSQPTVSSGKYICYHKDCEENPPEFDQAGELTKHNKNKHSAAEDLRFKCGTCGKLEMWEEHMKRHVGTHSDKRPFLCRFCTETYKRNDHATRHEKDKHKERFKTAGPRKSTTTTPKTRTDKISKDAGYSVVEGKTRYLDRPVAGMAAAGTHSAFPSPTSGSINAHGRS